MSEKLYPIEVTKEDLVNLVRSTKPKSMQECIDYTDESLMYFSGNQWCEDWDWEKEVLKNLSGEELVKLYNKHK